LHNEEINYSESDLLEYLITQPSRRVGLFNG